MQEYFTAKELAERYKLKQHRTIEKWVREGKFPKPVKLNGATRWKYSEIIEWECSRNDEKG